ncbi:MAG: nitrite/sulfite reductase [Deltaproteobacteria bacterium]|nr:nitrite/sulfite reductase [Deltaproteobacteria bacterium]
MRPSDADLKAALKGHASRVNRYIDGKLTDDQFRPIRLGYGLYYQLDHTSHMQRIKLPAGVMTAEQVDVLADIADDYGRGVIHVTTRQDVQIHWVGLDEVIPMYERLHAVGITTRGACADTVRNVTGCFHAGFLPGEPFDVTPYVFAAHEYFLFHPLNLTLPRKFKISFTSCAYDCVQAPINDIAYFPHQRDGKLGFAVHAGGGLGSQPFLARPVLDFIPVEDTLIVAEAIVRLQHRLGERKNRKRARMKYVFQRMGEEKFIAEVQRLIAAVDKEQGAALRAELREIVDSYKVNQPAHPGSPMSQTNDKDFAHWARTNTFEQKQPGYYGATVQLPLGDVTSAQFRALGQLSRDRGAGEMRAANDQNLMIPWIPGTLLAQVYRKLCEIGLGAADALHITDVVSCPGADYCSLAVSRSMGMAEAIHDSLVKHNGHIEEIGVFRIRISGCPNSCGQHHVGDIGLTGLSLKGDDGQDHPHYSMLVGARVGEDGATIGKRVSGRFPVDEVPKVITALAEHYRTQRQPGEQFADFVGRVGSDRLTEVARKAASIVR